MNFLKVVKFEKCNKINAEDHETDRRREWKQIQRVERKDGETDEKGG